MCDSGKVEYRTQRKALIALERTRRFNARGREGGERTAYRCPQCGWWHLTSLGRPKAAPKPPSVASLPRRASEQPRQPWEPRPPRSANAR